MYIIIILKKVKNIIVSININRILLNNLTDLSPSFSTAADLWKNINSAQYQETYNQIL